MGISPNALLRYGAIFTVVASLFGASASAANASCSDGSTALTNWNDVGSGAARDRHEIWTAEQLFTLSQAPEGLSAHFEQCADIDFSNFYSADRPYFTIGGEKDGNFPVALKGSYNGNNFTISKFTYDVTGSHYDELSRDGNDNVGLFGAVTTGGSVYNLNVTSARIVTDGRGAGIVAGNLRGGTVRDITVNGAVYADPRLGHIASQSSTAGTVFGGVVGEMSSGALLEDVYAMVDVQGRRTAGGAVGIAKDWGKRSELRNVLVKGSVTGVMHSASIGGAVGWIAGADLDHVESNASVRGSLSVGGLAGYARSSEISYSLATGDVSYAHTDSDHIGYTGGFIGSMMTKVNVSWSGATGNVKGRIMVGGFIGKMEASSSISNSYSTGDVVAMRSLAGGFVGESFAFHSYARTTPTIINSYAAGNVMAPEGKLGTFFGIAPPRYATEPLANASFAVGQAIDGASFGNGGVAANQTWYNADVTQGTGSGSAASLSDGHFDNPNRSLGVKWMHGSATGPAWYFQRGQLPTIPEVGAQF